MEPVKTAESNRVYRGPSAEVGDLWCHIPQPGEVRSTWEFTDEERQVIADGGRIELTLFNEPIPPIHLAVVSEESSRPVGEHPFRVTEPQPG